MTGAKDLMPQKGQKSNWTNPKPNPWILDYLGSHDHINYCTYNSHKNSSKNKSNKYFCKNIKAFCSFFVILNKHSDSFHNDIIYLIKTLMLFKLRRNERTKKTNR